MQSVLSYAVALACVLVFYLDTLLPWRVSPILTAVALAALGLQVLLSLRSPGRTRSSGVRGPSRLALAAALFGFLGSSMAAVLSRGYGMEEWGLFALQVAVPAMLLMAPPQNGLIRAILQVCLGFALLDAAANFLAVAGVVELPEMSARVDEFGRRQRYPGLAGNTHAAGLVAFLGACYVAYLARIRLTPFVIVAGIVVLASLLLIDARRYLVLTVLAVPLIYFYASRRIPLLALSGALAGFMLFRTFTADYADTGNQIRAMLLEDGFSRAMSFPLIGDGARYYSSEGVISTYTSLSMAGVTESLVLDLAITYGVLPTLLFLGACVLAMCARRLILQPPVVILALMTAELFFGGTLAGSLGAITFFACLTSCQKDGWARAPVARRHRVRLPIMPPHPVGQTPEPWPATQAATSKGMDALPV